MAHLRVEVDGEVRYDGEVGDHLIPEREEMFPRALGAPGTNKDPMNAPPLARLMILTQFIEMFRSLVESSMLRGNVDIKTHGAGKATLTVDMPGLGPIDDMRP